MTLYTLLFSSLLLVGVAEANDVIYVDRNHGVTIVEKPKIEQAKRVVIPYDDFLKMVAVTEHKDKLLNQCAAERAIYIKLNDENGTIKKLNKEQLQAVIEENETRRKLGETQEQINEALQKQLAKVTADLEAEKSKKYWWAGGSAVSSAAIVTAIFLWVVN